MAYERPEPFQSSKRWRQLAITLCGMGLLLLSLAYLQFGPEVYVPKARGISLPDQAKIAFSTDSRLETVIKQLVFITSQDKPEGGSTTINLGTGFLADRDLIVANEHLVGTDSSSPIIVICFGREKTAKVLYQDPLHDIAVLEAVGCGGEKVAFSAAALAPGELVRALGYEINKAERTARVYSSRLTVSAERTYLLPPDVEPSAKAAREAGIEVITLNGALRHGNSGSPIVRPSGDIVGMAVFILDEEERKDGQGQTLAVSAADIAVAIMMARAK
jgi:S1-C subfamily serine protease